MEEVVIRNTPHLQYNTVLQDGFSIIFQVATPVDWKQGGSVMVVPGVKQEQTGQLFPKGVTVHSVPSGKVEKKMKKGRKAARD